MKNKKKTIILSSIILGALVLTLGITYAVFTYNAQSANQQLILGDIWMSYNETSTNIQLKDAMPQELLADDFITKKAYLNPIMKEQTVEYENELTACVNLVSPWSMYLDEDSTLETYCQGTGTMESATIQEDLDNWMLDSEYYFEYLSSNNIIIQDGEGYVINPIMTNQHVGEINELMACVGLFIHFEYEFDEGTTAESFCKGSGTYDGLTYLEHGDNQTELYLYTYEYFKNQNVIIEHKFLLDVNLPYFEFQVNGKNTYTEQDIKYEIVLNNSEYIDEDGIKAERIADKFLKFSLVEITDLGPELVFHNRSYEDLTDKSVFTNTISNTDGTINRTYRLYMWIGDEVVIGGGEAAYDYDMETWNKIYASVRVDVKGDFIDKEVVNDYVPATDSASFKRLVNNQFQDTTYVDTDGTVYLSGTNDEVNYNYVWYSGKLWRITSMNPDGTMKLITDELITSIDFGANNKFYTDENTTSYMYQWLNQEFLPTLYNYENIIVTDAVWNASPGNEEISSKLPVSEQEEVLVNASVGLLNSYEYYKSYQNTSYSNGYLNIGCDWWLLNPYSASLSYIWFVSRFGNGRSDNVYVGGVRPSINLKSTIQLVEGSGTVDNPYRIKGDRENIEENVTLINTRGSGEYVKLVDEETAQTFRIVGTETINGNTTTKLVLNDYVRDTNDVNTNSNTTEVLELAFGQTAIWSSVSETDSTYWRGYLNNTWIKEVDPSYNSETGTFGMLEKGTYYLGSVSFGSNYKLAVCKTANNGKSVQECIDESTLETPTVQASILEYSGLLRFGEMFASQFRIGYGNYPYIWLITPSSSSTILYVADTGFGNDNDSPNALGARPTINLKSNLVIKSGDGTKNNPFIVGLPS